MAQVTVGSGDRHVLGIWDRFSAIGHSDQVGQDADTPVALATSIEEFLGRD